MVVVALSVVGSSRNIAPRLSKKDAIVRVCWVLLAPVEHPFAAVGECSGGRCHAAAACDGVTASSLRSGLPE